MDLPHSELLFKKNQEKLGSKKPVLQTFPQQQSREEMDKATL